MCTPACDFVATIGTKFLVNHKGFNCQALIHFCHNCPAFVTVITRVILVIMRKSCNIEIMRELCHIERWIDINMHDLVKASAVKLFMTKIMREVK
jgi:hypothetical protein